MWKNNISTWAQALSVTFMVTALVGCGKSSDSNTAPPPVGSGGVAGSTTNPTTGLPNGCVPITQAIPFVGQGVYVDSANIIGGLVPNSPYAQGQFGIGGGTPGPFTGTGVDGQVQLNIQATTTASPTGIGAPTGPATISGVLQISTATIQDIVYQISIGRLQIPSLGQNFWQNPNPAAICVSGMGMNLGHYNTTLYGGAIYVYFNGSTQGYGLVF